MGDDGEGNDGIGHMREGSTKRSRDSGGSGAEMGTVTASLNHSVNNNRHVGMVSVHCFGRSVPPQVHRGRGDDEAEKTNDTDALEGQLALVGDWLPAKEACRCLATMVTALPLPVEDDETNKGRHLRGRIEGTTDCRERHRYLRDTTSVHDVVQAHGVYRVCSGKGDTRRGAHVK